MRNRINKGLYAKLIVILIILSSFAILFIGNINEELKLPNEGWSRDIELPITSGNQIPFINKLDTGYEIYSINEEEKIDRILIDSDFNVIEESAINTKVTPLKPFWANNGEVIFTRDNNLILYANNQEKILAENINGMAANENLFVYWQDNKLFSLDQEYNSHIISQSRYEIERVVLDKYSANNFLLIAKPDSNKYQLILVHKEADGKFKTTVIDTINEYVGETINKFRFATDDSKINLIYTTVSTKAGNVTFRSFFTEMEINNLGTKPTYEQIKIYDTKTGEEVDSPRDIDLTIKDGKTSLLISTLGFISNKDQAVNIYEVNQIDGIWLADARSRTRDMSVNPVLLNDESILWLDFIGGNSYQLKGSSTRPQVIENSQAVNTNDLKFAFSQTILEISVSFLTLFNAIIWALAPTLFIVLLLIFNINLVEKNEPWVKITAILLYVAMQIFSSDNMFNYNFTLNAPDIFSFPYNNIVIPIVFGIISYGFLLLVRDDKWDSIKEVSVFVGINILMFLLYLGPYIA